MTTVNIQCRLAARPAEMLKASDWTIVEEPKPVAADGQFVVQVDYLSIDPAMRTWMNAGRSYVPPVEIGEVMRALGVGHVVESRHPGFAVGDDVSGIFGVQRYRRLRRHRGQQDRHRSGVGAGISQCPRDQRSDRVLRLARCRPARAGSDRAGLRGGRFGGQHRRPDRPDQGLPRGRRRRWRGQMPLAGRGRRIRRRDRLQERRPAQRAQDPRPGRCRRLFRQRRRGNAGGRTEPARSRRPHRAVRGGVAVQRHPARPVQLHATAGRTRIHDRVRDLRLCRAVPRRYCATGELAATAASCNRTSRSSTAMSATSPTPCSSCSAAKTPAN